MLKLSYRWLLPLLLLQSVATVASAETLFKVVQSSPSTPTDSYTASCTISPTTVVIEHGTNLWQSSSFSAKETKKVNVTAASLRKLINQAAKGAITGFPLIGGGTYQYFAYQKQTDGSLKQILLLDKQGGQSNDSPMVAPLTRFIDRVCGELVL
jgi:pantothenate kinase